MSNGQPSDVLLRQQSEMHFRFFSFSFSVANSQVLLLVHRIINSDLPKKE